MNSEDMNALVAGFKLLAETVAERIHDHEARIKELEEKVISLESAPRLSLSRQLRQRGKIL